MIFSVCLVLCCKSGTRTKSVPGEPDAVRLFQSLSVSMINKRFGITTFHKKNQKRSILLVGRCILLLTSLARIFFFGQPNGTNLPVPRNETVSVATKMITKKKNITFQPVISGCDPELNQHANDSREQAGFLPQYQQQQQQQQQQSPSLIPPLCDNCFGGPTSTLSWSYEYYCQESWHGDFISHTYRRYIRLNLTGEFTTKSFISNNKVLVLCVFQCDTNVTV